MKVIKGLIAILVVFLLMGCSLLGSSPKEFSGSGMTVTLTEEFVKGENIQAQLYIASNKYIFIGNGESRSALENAGIKDLTLSSYINLVLAGANKTADVHDYIDDDTHFKYAYYESTVEEITYSYMLVCMEGQSKFYTMNFASTATNFTDKTIALFLDWAKTIRVE